MHSPTASWSQPSCGQQCLHRARRGSTLMMKAISRASVFGCTLISCISFRSKKPPFLLRNQQSVATRWLPFASALKVYSLSDAEAAHPGAKLTPGKLPQMPQVHRKRAVAGPRQLGRPTSSFLSHCCLHSKRYRDRTGVVSTKPGFAKINGLAVMVAREANSWFNGAASSNKKPHGEQSSAP